MMDACCRVWMAPRFDAPGSVDVRHVCMDVRGHDGPCSCACRATADVRPLCDYRHDDGRERRAAWAFIGESGDYYACEDHFAMRTEEGKRGWQRV